MNQRLIKGVVSLESVPSPSRLKFACALLHYSHRFGQEFCEIFRFGQPIPRKCGTWKIHEKIMPKFRFLADRILRGFLLLGRRIFSRILSPDFFSSFWCEKLPRKSSRIIPSKILQNLHNKIPNAFLQRCRANQLHETLWQGKTRK